MTFFQLLSRFGTAGQALAELPRVSSHHQRASIPGRSEIEDEVAKLQNLGGYIICAADPAYPPLLKQLSPPPPVLSAIGNQNFAQKRTIAIVGARQASALGRKLARDLARDLAEAGFAIVSGLARGIDGEAHAASLEFGTIAVLGGGVDHIYPPQHRDLYKAISKQGLILSERRLQHRATARDFPRRNRIVTGLSEGVIVIEAAERSGSLISARTAAEQNREVFAVPGSPLDPRYEGSNRLLRDGAVLIRNADDVIEALSSPSGLAAHSPDPNDFELEMKDDGEVPLEQIAAVRAALSHSPVAIDEIARVAQLGPRRCAAIIVELELEGTATTLPGGLVVLALE